MTETNWRSQSLPESFKAINRTSACIYTCKRESEGQYKITWQYNGSGNYNVIYGEDTLKEIIYRDCNWRIMEDTKKQLPTRFQFTCPNVDLLFTAELFGHEYKVTWDGMSNPAYYDNNDYFAGNFTKLGWKIVEDVKQESLACKLPEKFKFTSTVCIDKQRVFTAILDFDVYKVTFHGAVMDYWYGVAQMQDEVAQGKFIIQTNAAEETLEQCPGKQIVSLQDIQEFCKECSAEITFAYIHGEPHYDVFFGDTEIAQAESDEKLMEIMKAIRVLYGKKG